MINEEYLRIARIAGPHGINGMLKIQVFTDFPERFDKGNSIYLEKSNGYIEYIISNFIKNAGRYSLLKLEGIDTRENAIAVKGNQLFIKKATAEETRHSLDEDSFFYYELINCEVYINNSLFGRITDIMEAGAGELLVLADGKGKKYMIPFVESMVDTTAVKKRRIDVYPPEGLLDI